MTTNNTFSNQKREGNNTFCNLTEQWKRGELPDGFYYADDDGGELIILIRGKKGSVFGDDFDLKATDWIKPIAPVPSWEQWQQMKAFCEGFNALDVAKENQKLKELLKECRDDVYNYHYICLGTLTKIDEVLNVPNE